MEKLSLFPNQVVILYCLHDMVHCDGDCFIFCVHRCRSKRMISRKLKIAPVVLFLLYFLTVVLRSELPYFFRFHFTDLLFVPLQLIIALCGLRIIKQNKQLKIPVILILLVVLCDSVLFEWYLPNFSENVHLFTGDFSDVLMYVIGGLLFWGIQRGFE